MFSRVLIPTHEEIMIVRSQEELTEFLKTTFDPQRHRLHITEIKRFPCMLKWAVIEDVYHEVYFCPFDPQEAVRLLNTQPIDGPKQDLHASEILDMIVGNIFVLLPVNNTKATRTQLEAMVKQGILRQDSIVSWHLTDEKFLTDFIKRRT